MRGDVQAIFKLTPHDKQVMMFSATLSSEVRPICKKFMSDVRLPTSRARLSAAHPHPSSLQTPNAPPSPERLVAAGRRGAAGPLWSRYFELQTTLQTTPPEGSGDFSARRLHPDGTPGPEKCTPVQNAGQEAAQTAKEGYCSNPTNRQPHESEVSVA
jgi:hypothetical protein